VTAGGAVEGLFARASVADIQTLLVTGAQLARVGSGPKVASVDAVDNRYGLSWG
jgi:hypothetical protein